MTITIKLSNGKSVNAKLAHTDAEHVLAKTDVHPGCATDGVLPVRGGEPTVGHDTYTASAHCHVCGENIGTMVVRVSTIFGIEEDDRVFERTRPGVLVGRWRPLLHGTWHLEVVHGCDRAIVPGLHGEVYQVQACIASWQQLAHAPVSRQPRLLSVNSDLLLALNFFLDSPPELW